MDAVKLWYELVYSNTVKEPRQTVFWRVMDLPSQMEMTFLQEQDPKRACKIIRLIMTVIPGSSKAVFNE